ncbi:MAG TPA: hypothetical protein VLG69_03980 [Candidatus Andersenbacteria bacterium]|nr:hypothetical protein [Candidatus Andersenbacteria bacterium]
MLKDYKYLKPDQHYIDLYDSHTIDYCRSLKQGFVNKTKKVLPKMNKGWSESLADVAIYFYSGDRAIKKEETISKWMRGDRERDQKLELTEPPPNIFCRMCGEAMTCESKGLHDAYTFPLQVIFLFRCASCKKGRAIFENGKEWEREKKPCPKCHALLEEKGSNKGRTFTTLYTCLNCPYTEKDEFTLSAPIKEKPDPYFERDRAKFCFSNQQTSDYLEQKITLESLSKSFDELKERDKHKDVYDAAAKLQKLTLDQLEKTLIAVMAKNEYVKLELGAPEVDQYVIIPFTVRDAKPNREARSSELDLQRLLRKTLEPTSWRLMNEGVSYRLGILSGKLKGYEREEDLVRLVEQVQKKKSQQRFKKNGSIAGDGEDGYIL